MIANYHFDGFALNRGAQNFHKSSMYLGRANLEV